MTRGALAIVADAREHYDDRAMELARAGRAAGWQVAVLLISIGSQKAELDGGDGIAVTRVGASGMVPTPHAVALRALEDRVAVLTSRRVALDLAGEPPRSVRRTTLRAALRKARTMRDELAADGATLGDPVAAAAAELKRLDERLREPLLKLKADVVVVAGPCGLELATEVASGRVFYDRRPAVTATEPAWAAVVAAVEERVAARLGAVVDQAPVTGDPIAPKVPRLLVPEPARGGCDWTPVLDRVAGLMPPDADPALMTSDADPALVPGDAATDLDQAAQVEQLDAATTSHGPVVLGITPANFAGQGWAWARSAERDLPDVTAEVVANPGGFGFRSDVALTAELTADLDWQLAQAKRVLGGWTHVLAESVRPVLGQLNGSTLSGDMAALRRAGVHVAVVCHGSEIRRPSHHAATYPFSPFAGDWDGLLELAQRADRNRGILHALDIPVFVSTPDLLDDVPHARWLPVVVDEADLGPAKAPFQRAVPVVLHLPSSPRLKGTTTIDAVGQRLADEGLIEYRSLRDVPAPSIAELIRDADVVIDHIVIGNYGVLACQAMAAGRLTIGHIHERVRRRVGRTVPVLEATPETLEAVLRSALADPTTIADLAASGPEFVRDLHDGRVSAQVLARFLGR
ncbi:MAG: hypothetical protein ABIP19_04780 [Dermatophilaceae bacterium]